MYTENKFSTIVTRILLLLFIIITGYLFIVSLFSTVYISEYENVYYISDNCIINLITLLIFISVTFIFKDKVKKVISCNERKMVLLNTVVLSLILIFFVMSTRFYPLYDQAKVLNTVKKLFVYDYSDFMPGGYIDKCDVQKGITLYFYIISKICGKISITTIQLLNSVYIVLSNFLIYKIFEKIYSKSKAALIHFAMCLYMPQWLYSSFVYGILPSYFFGVLATYCFINVVYSSSKKNKYINCLLSGLFLGISIALKTNSVIILLALVLLSVFFMIVDKDRIKYLSTIVSMVIFYLLFSIAVDKTVTMISDYKIQGIPRTAHIAMAIMENTDRGPGWYNGYSEEVYVKNGFDKEKADEEAKKSIAESINGFKSNKAGLISFVSRKIVSQWNDPTYESLFILYGRDSLGAMPSWVQNLTNPTTDFNRNIRKLFDMMQLIVLFGVLLYFISDFSTINMRNLIPGIIILGGFFFHILWEAKSQYILIYFLLMIPYSVLGYNSFQFKVKSLLQGKKEINSKDIIVRNIIKNREIDFIIIMFVIILFTAIVPDGSIFGKILKPSWKTEAYKEVTNSNYNNYQIASTLDSEYAAALKMPKLKQKKGRYYICKSDNVSFVLSPETENTDNTRIGFYDKTENSIDRRVILFNNSQDEISIRFQSSQKVVDITSGIISEGNTLQQWEYNGDPAQRFVLEKVSENEYYIKKDELYLGEDIDRNIILTDRNNAVKVNIIKAE